MTTRDEFEKWHAANYKQPITKWGDRYKNSHVQGRWQGWVAAAGASPVQPSQALELSDKNEPAFAWWCESSDCITRSSHVLNNWITKGIKAIPLYK